MHYPCKEHLPEVYKTERPLHDDWLIKGIPAWLQPWAKIPRAWTGYCFAMPPKKVWGNAEPAWVLIQKGYPLAPDARLSPNAVWSMHPVHPVGQWSVQSVYLMWLGFRVPCYFSFSRMLWGRRLHMNGGIKPDVTRGDWFWWFEGSLTWTKLK